MRDIDATIAGFSPDRDHSFKIRGEVFHGQLGLDYELVTNYYGAASDLGGTTGGGFQAALTALLMAFLGGPEFSRFEEWRLSERDKGNPLTIYEASLIAAAVVEEETNRPTRASSDSSTGRETNGAGSTAVSYSPASTTVPDHSLSAVS